MSEPFARKIRYAKKGKMNKRVPLWAIMRTRRRVRDHPKRHHWRITSLKV